MAGSIPESERAILENAYPDHRSLGKAYFTLKWVDEYVQPILSEKYNRMRYRFLRVRMASAYAGDCDTSREFQGAEEALRLSEYVSFTAGDSHHGSACGRGRIMLLPARLWGMIPRCLTSCISDLRTINARRRWRSFPR